MPRSMVTNRYPVQFLELVDIYERVWEKGFPPIPCGSNKAAKAYQLELCAFRNALRHENVIDEYPNFNHAEIRVSGEYVHLLDKDRTDSAKITQRILDGMKTSDTSAA